MLIFQPKLDNYIYSKHIYGYTGQEVQLERVNKAGLYCIIVQNERITVPKRHLLTKDKS